MYANRSGDRGTAAAVAARSGSSMGKAKVDARLFRNMRREFMVRGVVCRPYRLNRGSQMVSTIYNDTGFHFCVIRAIGKLFSSWNGQSPRSLL